MRHRGPDDAGYHVADRIAIGVRRLSIIDVVDGHQPFANERGTVVAAQNGELYNHDAIRRRLERDGQSSGPGATPRFSRTSTRPRATRCRKR